MPFRRKNAPAAQNDDEEAKDFARILSRSKSQALIRQPPASISPLPPLRPASPLFHKQVDGFITLNDRPVVAPKPRQNHHRRSRSFSSLSPSKISVHGIRTPEPFPSIVADRDTSSTLFDHPVNQPWRSHATWKALHSPTIKPSPPPKSRRPYGDSGWRGNGTGGFFAGGNTAFPKQATDDSGRMTSRPTVLGTPEAEIRFNSFEMAPAIPRRQSSLRSSSRSYSPLSTVSPTLSFNKYDSPGSFHSESGSSNRDPVTPAVLASRRSSEHTITSEETCQSQIDTPTLDRHHQPFEIPTIVKAPSTPVRSATEPSYHDHHHQHYRQESDGESCTLLPPLTPRSILKPSSRSFSFANVKSAADDQMRGTLPIPWGRRGTCPIITPSASPIPSLSGQNDSTASTTARLRSRAPQRPLPRPPPDNVPDSPENDIVRTEPVVMDFEASSSRLRAAMDQRAMYEPAICTSGFYGQWTSRFRDRSGSNVTQKSCDSGISEPSLRVVTPRQDSTEFACLGQPNPARRQNGDGELASGGLSPNKRAGIIVLPGVEGPDFGARSPTEFGVRLINPSHSLRSMSSIKSVERGGWL
ncbi:hypothetical protein BD324DRAFT_464506 [Kockovaella imperatae]|uniref:Uncharacterized protein n=1 Tax=Kockovaella imperatae TaxID=4999 RepID=A0A1Y1UFH3_9TREE|nr:hypothetical protein BD324DRAFT_464506 [Kockovaella imperatae]ORX36739.1 hypothetical protein BD324DRAFT_464506 [Kockovaella imperatae]